MVVVEYRLMGRYNNARYITETNRLVIAGRELEAALKDPAKRAAVEAAAQPKASEQLNFESSMGGGVLAPESGEPDDGLRAVLFDLQSANLLIASGLATEVDTPNASQLSQVLDQIEESQLEITAPPGIWLAKFEDGSVARSGDIETAKKSFREDAKFALDRFVTDSADVVQSVFDQLKKLDGAEVVKAIENLGKPFQAAVDAGRLIKKGIEKLLQTLQNLLNFIGGDALGDLKSRAEEIWKKLVNGDYVREILSWAFGTKETETRIETILSASSLETPNLDSATNSLRPLTVSYASKMKLIKALLGAVVLIAAGLAYFHVAIPWLPLVIAGIYTTLVGATVLIGMNYSGAGGALRWVKGVREIADGLSPAET